MPGIDWCSTQRVFGARAPLQGGTGATQYFYFLTLRLWALHGKNRLQKAFVPLNIRRLAERLLRGQIRLNLTRAPLALQLFQHLLGGGIEHPPSISAPIVLREKRKNDRKLVKNDNETILVKFSLKSKLWPAGARNVQNCEFFAIFKHRFGKSSFLRNCYSYSESKNGIRNIIKFLIAILSPDLT